MAGLAIAAALGAVCALGGAFIGFGLASVDRAAWRELAHRQGETLAKLINLIAEHDQEVLIQFEQEAEGFPIKEPAAYTEPEG